MKAALVGFVTLAVLAAPAQALSIKNLSDTTRTLTLQQGGNQQELVLEPGDTRYLMGGDMTLSMPGERPVEAKFEEEYVIWPDGDLILQKINKVKSGSR